MPPGGLRRSRGSPGRALGPAGVWTGASGSLPPHAPQDPQKPVCKVGFTEPTLWGPGCRLVPQCGHHPKAGSQAPLAPSPQAGSWPGSGVYECDPRPPAAPAAPGMSPRASAAGRKVCHLPRAACHLSAAWGSLGTRGRCLPGDAPSSPCPVGRSAEQETWSSERGARSQGWG